MRIKADLHVHSSASDDGRCSVAELALAAAEAGLDAIAVCDHNYCTDVPEKEAGALIIPGVEISTDAGHILGLFLERPVNITLLRKRAAVTGQALPFAEDAVCEIHKCGGIAVIAHPFERRGADDDRLASLNADLIETANSRAGMKIRNANEKADIMADRLGVGKTGGSDAHGKAELGGCYTLVEAKSLTRADIKEALLSHRCEAVFLRECSWCCKALSQWAKARRSRNLVKILKALAYIAAAPVRDIARNQK